MHDPDTNPLKSLVPTQSSQDKEKFSCPFQSTADNFPEWKLALTGPLGRNSLELIELSSINKVSLDFLMHVVSQDQEGMILTGPLGRTV